MNVDRILHNTIITGIFVLPFLVFVVTNSMFFPFITGKNFAFRIIVEILFGLWLILAIRNVSFRPSFSWLLVAVGAFISIMTLADVFGENPFKSFWSNFERMEGLVTLLHLGAYFLIAGTVINTKKLWFAFANISVGASVIMGIYSLLQLSGKFTINQGGVRVDGTFGNAAYLAIYMLFHVFITGLLFVYWRGSSVMRYVYGAIIFLQAYILLATATRGTMLGLLGGSFLTVALIAIFGREYPRLRKIAVVACLSILVMVTGFYFVRDTDVIQNHASLSRLANISLEEGGSRFTIWSMALEGVKERPLLGWGQENFNYIFNTYYDPSLFADEPWFDRAHNVFFDWFTAGGILGLVTYLSLFGTALFLLWRRQNNIHFSVLEKSLITGAFAGYFFHNLFVFDNIFSYIIFFSFLAFIYSTTRGSVNAHVLSKPLRGTSRYVFSSCAIVIIPLLIYGLNVPGIKTSATLIDALSTSTGEQQIELFEEAGGYNSIGSQEVAEQLVQLATVTARSDAPPEISQSLFVLAKTEIEEEIERAPDDARLHVFLASLYTQFGQTNNAIAEFSRALELSPQKQRIRYQLAFVYVDQGDYETALDIFKNTYVLDPRSGEAGAYYGATALYVGDFDLAEEILKPIRARHKAVGSTLDYTYLLNAYVHTGQYDKSLEIWNHRLKGEPNNINFRLSKVATLIRLERTTEAIDEIRRAITLEPRFKEQGEFFISEIRAGRGESLVQ